MVNLLEYQAKELFREKGIPVLPSQRIDHPRELKALRLPYPVVLKSQVRAGGRGRAGGVRFVENTIDAIAAARTIFNLPIVGEYPKVLLAEAKYNATREFYLAVMLDYTLRRPVLLGSPQGGIDIDAVMQQMQQVVVEEQFSPFYARRLAVSMGLGGALLQSVSAIIEKMYQLFIEKDLDLVEINPLGVSASNEVMALDGKIAANDRALGRHPELQLLTSAAMSAKKTSLVSYTGGASQVNGLNWINREGNIGIICNDNSLAIATLDLIYQAEGKPSCCLIAGEDTPASASEQLEQALEHFAKTKSIKVVLVNILDNPASSQEVAQTIATYLQKRREEKASPHSFPPLVLRLVGLESQSKPDPLSELPVQRMDNLDEAIAKTVALTKSGSKKS